MNFDALAEQALQADICTRIDQVCICYGPDGWAHVGRLVAVTRDHLVLDNVARIFTDGRHHHLMAGAVPTNAEIEAWPADARAYICIGGTTVAFAPAITVPLATQ